MEIFLDEKAVLLLRSARLSEPEVRLTVATIKINNDLERIGDLTVNIAERLLALSALRQAGIPRDVAAMTKPVRDMLTSSITAIRERDLEAAAHVLETDAVVDRYRDQLFMSLTETMSSDPQHVPVDIHFILISRHLERIADHATNIAEDVIYWLRGIDVRHGQGFETSQWPHP
jgi:phosphate transport system protein